MNQICPNFYTSNEGQLVGCMGWLRLEQVSYIFSNDEKYKCHLCGFTVIIHKKVVNEI